MTEQKRTILSLHRNTDPVCSDLDQSAAGSKRNIFIQLTRKKKLVIVSPSLGNQGEKKREKNGLSDRTSARIRHSNKSAPEKKAACQVTHCPGKKPPGFRKRMTLPEALQLLQTWWPALTAEGKIQPLAVGIRQALLDDIRARGLDISVKKLKRCLAVVARSEQYLSVMMQATWRVDLSGRPVAPVTAAEAVYSLERIGKERARRAQKMKNVI